MLYSCNLKSKQPKNPKVLFSNSFSAFIYCNSYLEKAIPLKSQTQCLQWLKLKTISLSHLYIIVVETVDGTVKTVETDLCTLC